MTSIELLKEIEVWLSFNTKPSKKETAKLRKSIKEHLTEQLREHSVAGRSEHLPKPTPMDLGKLTKELLDKKANENNTIDLNAYVRGGWKTLKSN